MRSNIRTAIGPLALFVMAGALPATGEYRQAASAPAKTGIRVKVDPRIELICVVFRLAGNPEYNMARVDSYTADVDRHFGPFKNHPAVQRARSLRQTRGVSFDAPMSLAVHLTDATTLKGRVPFDPLPPAIDPRWTPATVQAFLTDLRAFARESHFQSFFDAHRALYATAVERMNRLLQGRKIVEWFDGFFGARPGADFTIALGLLNGPGNYGPHARLADGRDDLYAVIGAWKTDSTGLPAFEDGVVSTVVHEFGHSYANPLVDRHLADLRAAGETIFPHVAEQMRSQAYGGWETMMRESLVRACEVRYAAAQSGPEAALKVAKYNEGRGFLWTERLGILLSEYEQRRGEYRDLEAYFPRITRFFADCADTIEIETAAAKADSKKP